MFGTPQGMPGTMRTKNTKSMLTKLLAKRWALVLLVTALVLDATTLPSFSTPKKFVRSFSFGFHCYMPWTYRFNKQNGVLVPVTGVLTADATASVDVALFQPACFWAPTSEEYRTVIGDWYSNGNPLTPVDHAAVKALVIADLEALSPGRQSTFLELLKTKGEGSFSIALPLGYVHNALALTAFILLVISCRLQLATLSTRARQRAARARGECVVCAYSLVGCRGSVCPECGTDQG